jgi:poly(3-hydroxybutyrate) depolymerase
MPSSLALSVAMLLTSPAPPADALDRLRAARGPVPISEPWTAEPLSRADADRAAAPLWTRREREIRDLDASSFRDRVVRAGDARMRFAYATFGKKPKSGRSLWISLHGGGGAPPAVNDSQWENQKRLYRPAEGIYVAPRAPGDTWDLWHRPEVDALLAALIRDMQVFEDVDPDRVYLLGYSAGGDGVYQLAPRLADRFAGAAMMAGHPNETRPDGLRNLPFALHMGANDAAFDRNKIAGEWKQKLAALAAADPGGYPHVVEIHEGKGHWMDLADAVALPWMARNARNIRPERVTWLQDDVTHRRLYWLAVDEPKAGARLDVRRDGQVFTILDAKDVAKVRIRLDDSMCDLSKEVVVRRKDGDGERELFRGVPQRTIATIAATLGERDDTKAVYPAEVVAEVSAGK